MKLTDRLDDTIEYRGRKIRLGLYFDVVLRAFELLQDEYFTEAEKIDILLQMFVENPDSIAGLDMHEKTLIVQTIFDKFISDGEAKQTGNEKPILDFEKDAAYIYASFMQDYGIDLFEAQGKLHWKKFKALLFGLRDDTKLMKVIGYRTMDVPPPGKIPHKERQRLLELKRFYSLDNSQTADDIDSKFDQLADILRPKTNREGD